jgi:glucose/arabinose dehydrogenase/Ca2+-binding RTX toxin-like protein
MDIRYIRSPSISLCRLRAPRLVALLGVAALSSLGFPEVAKAATVPAGFISAQFVGGLSSATGMEFSPDGRLFISQQAGLLRVVKGGALLSAPALSLTVNSEGERGLLGLAFDPNFPASPYIYVFYTATTPTVHNRLSRFTLTGDVADPASEVPIMDLETLGAIYHNSGAVHFGPDGKLYVSVGENTLADHAQSLNDRLGKVLRMNSDGSIPMDNPFYNVAVGENRQIWALGLRNPFSFNFQPGTNRVFINDVGQGSWEEINDGIAGANYGWPTTEGPTTDPRFRGPIYAYQHGTTETTGCAVTGGTFYNPPTVQFPSSYVGKYFFTDYCGDWIRILDPANGNAVSSFASSVGKAVDLEVGSDGSLYSLARSAVTRIRYGSSVPPSVTAQPQDVTVAVGQSALFTVSAAGTAPLAYQWQRNGLDIPDATSSAYTVDPVAATDDGARFRVRVTNGFGTTTSNEAVLHVPTGSPPTAEIVEPFEGTLYEGGTRISFSGTGDDPEDLDLPASAYTWEVLFHHDDHTHPFMQPTSGMTGGFLDLPNRGETSASVFYRIHLTVTDSDGLSDQVFRDVSPHTTTLALVTQPAGLGLTLDGQPVATPFSATAVVGMIRQLGAATTQSALGSTWQFASWSDGQAAVHEIALPPSGGSYTATYQATSAVPTCRGIAATVTGSGNILGTAGPDVIVGSAGGDVIQGLGGDDVICGGGGNDRLVPGSGNDVVDGGSGVDGVSFEGSGAGVTANLGSGTATGEGTDLMFSLENIIGSNFADSLTGSTAANGIWAGGGADIVRGLDANDQLYGNAGNDSLEGGNGNDRLSGGLGNDTLNGGAGTDTCTQDGGSGSATSC